MGTINHTGHGECRDFLLAHHIPSRLNRRDASLFATCAQPVSQVADFLGWTNLSSKPPLSVAEITAIATDIRREGLEAVVLIGQGGSSQASMTITKLYEVREGGSVAFRTMDSLSPVFVNHILGSSDPARTLYIVSSKSGCTIEPLVLERVAWHYVTGHLGSPGTARRFVAITDRLDSRLGQLATAKNYRYVLQAPGDVGGRFSALSVFGLFPVASIGIDIAQAVNHAAAIEDRCGQDQSDNPALDLACFIYSNYCAGRDKISLVMPPSGQVFGLWLEQLIAESLGKQERGILPNVEVDASILSVPRADRCIISYEVGEPEGFAESLQNFDPSIPARHYSLNSVPELFGRFVIWEYAVAMLGLLMGVNPFDQPDVEDTKKRVNLLLGQLSGAGGVTHRSIAPSDATVGDDYLRVKPVATEKSEYVQTLQISRALLAVSDLSQDQVSIDRALRALFKSLRPGDYFSLNAFVPFRGYGRREALERMRNRIASRLGVASCLEIGSRYLHSTGQLHKGGPNTGVFLFISADEDNDIIIPDKHYSLGELAVIQAQGDFAALAARGRRAVLLHLSGNGSETLSHLADRFCLAVSAVRAP